MFTATPTCGQLLSVQDGGTSFTVAYKPKFYGKVHRAKLLIQVSHKK